MSCTFTPARLTHVGPIANGMRAMDRRECLALGRSPKDALRWGLRCSQDAWTALEDGRPAAMMGVASDGLLAGSGRVWFLGTDEVFKHPRDLLTYGPLFLERWMLLFDRLHNIVMVENERAIKLLMIWGFNVDPETVKLYGEGLNREAFVSFSMARKKMEPVAGIEPASVPYEGTALPLS